MKIRLTQLTQNGGCGCKIDPTRLSEILQGFQQANQSFPNVLVGSESSDDAAIVQIDEHRGIVSTTDFFMPIVDDPFDFGSVAACNAISDIYAMGAKPLMAIAILAWPLDKLPLECARSVLDGATKLCHEAGIPLCGGHSIRSQEPIFGLAVTGEVQLNKIKRNNTATDGCKILLTKPIGVGLHAAALKRGLISEEEFKREILTAMTSLNKAGYEVFSNMETVKSMTDVTGFGLLGHLSEMCRGAGLSATLDVNKIPLLFKSRELAEQGCCPGATRTNFQAVEALLVSKTPLEARDINLLCDPQTSGGLLIAYDGPLDEQEGTPLFSSGAVASSRLGGVEVASSRLGGVEVYEIGYFHSSNKLGGTAAVQINL